MAANVSDAAMPVSAGPTGSVRLPVAAIRSASPNKSCWILASAVQTKCRRERGLACRWGPDIRGTRANGALSRRLSGGAHWYDQVAAPFMDHVTDQKRDETTPRLKQRMGDETHRRRRAG